MTRRMTTITITVCYGHEYVWTSHSETIQNLYCIYIYTVYGKWLTEINTYVFEQIFKHVHTKSLVLSLFSPATKKNKNQKSRVTAPVSLENELHMI